MIQEETFDHYRPLLFAISYRMLGSAADAEDIVQEAFLRWHRSDTQQIQSPRAFLSTVVTRLSIDHLRSARIKREVYVGPWLPEPLYTGPDSGFTGAVEQADSLSMAFLILLETLTPVERAVFLLREVFEFDYAEVARMVEKSEANCRQIVRRAQQHLAERRPRFEVSKQQQEQLTGQFIRACTSGDLTGLMALLTGDIVLYSDGGGKVQAARNPVQGAERVARFILGLMKKAPPNFELRLSEVNGQPALLGYQDGQPNSVITFNITADPASELTSVRLSNIYVVANPDKLTHIPALNGLG